MDDNQFHCERLHATLSKSVCIKRYNDGVALACRHCPLGAAHAGIELRTDLDLSATCSRCQRVAPRLIFNRLCHSCYNRQLGSLKGIDRRGKPSKLKIGLAICAESKSSFAEKVATTTELYVEYVRRGNENNISRKQVIAGHQIELLLFADTPRL